LPGRETEQLGTGLKVRHLTMMGLGSAIGAGLFLATGIGIRTAGPAILVSHVLAGLLTVRTWGYPYLSWLRLGLLVALVGLMLTDDGARPQVFATAALVTVVVGIFLVREHAARLRARRRSR